MAVVAVSLSCVLTTESIIIQPSPDCSPAILVFPYQVWTHSSTGFTASNRRWNSERIWHTQASGGLTAEFLVYFSRPTTMWGSAVAMVCVVRPFVCHTWISPKLSEIDVWLLRTLNRNPGFPIFRSCHQIRDRKYGSVILGVSGSLSLINCTVKTVPHWAPLVGQLSSRPTTDNTLYCFVPPSNWKRCYRDRRWLSDWPIRYVCRWDRQ